jgi:hypothetical protein
MTNLTLLSKCTVRREVVELWIAAFHCGLDCKLKCQERFLHFLRQTLQPLSAVVQGMFLEAVNCSGCALFLLEDRIPPLVSIAHFGPLYFKDSSLQCVGHQP